MDNSTKIRKILVTGSSGTIGTRFCERLLEEGFEVTGIDLKPNIWNSKVNEITIIGDLCEKTTLDKIPMDFDIVVHLAANARVYNLVINPSLAKDNFKSLFNILEATRKNKIKRFIFASSREVYGNSKRISYTEDEAYVKNCESPYTATKIGGEALIHSYQQCYDINFIILRFSNVYGMYDNSDRVIPQFIKRTLENKNLMIYGKSKLLDFTYIDDCIDGILKSIINFDEVKNNTFNISLGKGSTIMEVANLVRKLMNKNNSILIKETRTGEVTKFIADISKAKKILGYSPKVDIEKGIRKSIEWYKNNIKG